MANITVNVQDHVISSASVHINMQHKFMWSLNSLSGKEQQIKHPLSLKNKKKKKKRATN